MISARLAPTSASWASLAGGLGAVLLPKCPLCFAAYGSALGALGLSPSSHQWLVEPLIAVAAVMSFGLVATLSIRRRDVVTPLVSAAGVLLVVAGVRVGRTPNHGGRSVATRGRLPLQRDIL